MAIEDKNMKTYEQGLEDAWAAARAIGKSLKDGGLDFNELDQIFGMPLMTSIFNNFTAAEAIVRIKAYEEEQQEIKVGDNEYSEPIVSGEVDIVCGKREKKDGDET